MFGRLGFCFGESFTWIIPKTNHFVWSTGLWGQNVNFHNPKCKILNSCLKSLKYHQPSLWSKAVLSRFSSLNVKNVTYIRSLKSTWSQKCTNWLILTLDITKLPFGIGIVCCFHPCRGLGFGVLFLGPVKGLTNFPRCRMLFPETKRWKELKCVEL